MHIDTVKSEEIWKPIKGWETLYEVSDQGRIRSFDKYVTCRGGGKAIRRGRILVPVVKCGRYHAVTLADGELRIQISIHDLVLLNFVGEKPEGFQSCHNNGNKADNSLKNLRYDTAFNNNQDKFLHGTVAKGIRNGNAKLSEADVLEIRKKKGFRGVDLADQYGVSPTQIWSVQTRKTWKHL